MRVRQPSLGVRVPGQRLDGTELPPSLREAIEELVRRKRAGAELDSGPRIPVISDFCESELVRLEPQAAGASRGDLPAVDALNDAFREVLDLGTPG